MLGKRGDIRLDELGQKKTGSAAMQVLSAAHAYQTSSARDELALHYHSRADLLSKTPSLLIVSTNGAGYDTVDVKACTERGVLVVNQSGGNAEAVAEHVVGMMLCLVKRFAETDRALRAGRSTTVTNISAARRSAEPSASSAWAMSASGSPNLRHFVQA